MELEKFARKALEEARSHHNEASELTDRGSDVAAFAALSTSLVYGQFAELASALAVDLAALRQELTGRVTK